MKFTTEELILAAHIRDLAAKIRSGEWEDALADWEGKRGKPPEEVIGYTEEDRAKNVVIRRQQDEYNAEVLLFKEQWADAHPIASFAKKALGKIEEVAIAIRA